MREVFKGWRRKAGCVALVLATALMGAWIRSLIVSDTFMWDADAESIQLITSNGGGLTWGAIRKVQVTYPFDDPALGMLKKIGSVDFYYADNATFRDHGNHIPTDSLYWGSCGFQFGEIVEGMFGMKESIWTMPYWSATIPLTLLSAYLILWKPRTKVERDA